MNNYYIPFTKEMKKEYTILIPNMLPVHFNLMAQVLRNYGYKAQLLETSGPQITDLGLKYVHNDTCYPALLVIGQFLDALQSGNYDKDKVALILFQTGGGCRASNYISLLRKALQKAGYGNVPVISLSLKSLEKHSGFKLTIPLITKMLYAVLFGDLIQNLSNQTRPYEKFGGDTNAAVQALTREITDLMKNDKLFFTKTQVYLDHIARSFAKIPLKDEKKVKVGIVGEIFVKYSPLGNNNLEKFLLSEGAEIVCPGFLDFCLYCLFEDISDYRLYGMKRLAQPFTRACYKFILHLQKKLISTIENTKVFAVPSGFEHIRHTAEKYISVGAQMGEGWLLPAEMLELSESGVNNIVCTQPFGCLPNHIFGKGMMKPLKDKNRNLNIVAIDYDPGASKVNQENRIRLMLSNAEEKSPSKL